MVLTPPFNGSTRNRNVLLAMMRAAGGDNTAGLAQVIHAEVLAPWLGTAAGPAMLRDGAGGPTAVPLVAIGPLAPENGATVYPFSKSAVLRRLLSDQVRAHVCVRARKRACVRSDRRLVKPFCSWSFGLNYLPTQSACFIFHRMINGVQEFA